MRKVLAGAFAPFLGTVLAFGQTSCDADINGDQVVNLEDLLGMLIHYGDSCKYAPVQFPTLVISEIHYNPNSAQGNDSDWEFLELFNPTDETVALLGWKLDNAISLSFSEEDSISAQQFVLIARNADTLSMVVPSETPVFQWDSGGSLNNSGETITLLNPNEEVVVSIAYEDNDGWVDQPDGAGPSLELMDYHLPNEEVASWSASFLFGGTPGATNSMWGLSETE